jgi:hypothetical protein
LAGAGVKSGKNGKDLKKDGKARTSSLVSRKPLTRKVNGNVKARFLAKLLPNNDDCYLIEFHSDNNDHSNQMEPVLQRLEEDLQTKVRRVNINRRREFYGLMEAMGHDECGSLPFYYNRRTAQAVCGATSYLNLKRWATGDLKHLFQDPPENMFEQEVDNSRKRKVGAGGFLQEKLVGAAAAAGGGAAEGGAVEETSKGKGKVTGKRKGRGKGKGGTRTGTAATSATIGSGRKQKKSARELRAEKRRT